MLDSIFCIFLKLLLFCQLLSSEALPFALSFSVYLPAGVDRPDPTEACIPEENELQGSHDAGILHLSYVPPVEDERGKYRACARSENVEEETQKSRRAVHLDDGVFMHFH